MVGRNVLDGLRKGKKDLYALNVQYVKRYSDAPPSSVHHCALEMTLAYLPHGRLTQALFSLEADRAGVCTATSSNGTIKFSPCDYNRKNDWTDERKLQWIWTEPARRMATRDPTQMWIRTSMMMLPWAMHSARIMDPKSLSSTSAARICASDLPPTLCRRQYRWSLLVKPVRQRQKARSPCRSASSWMTTLPRKNGSARR